MSCEGQISLAGAAAENMGRLVLTSEAVAALGRRREVRVSLPRQGVPGMLGQGIRCRVVDVSAGGLGVVVSDLLSVDCVVGVVFEFAGKAITGKARVANRRRQEDGQFRCGLAALDTEADLRRQLQEAVLAAQRQQLRRMGWGATAEG